MKDARGDVLHVGKAQSLGLAVGHSALDVTAGIQVATRAANTRP